MKNALLRGAFVTMALAGNGCSECEKCQEAIDHMAGKIRAQGCDPTPMEGARKRIEEDCKGTNTSVNRVAGVLAEECHAVTDNEPFAECMEAGDDVSVTILYQNNAAATAEYFFDGVSVGTLTPGATVTQVHRLTHDASFPEFRIRQEGAETDVNANAIDQPEKVALRFNPDLWQPWLERRISYDGLDITYSGF